jgi:hypothetical protein
MGNENGYSKAILFYILLFFIKTINFPNKIVILRTKRNFNGTSLMVTTYLPASVCSRTKLESGSRGPIL